MLVPVTFFLFGPADGGVKCNTINPSAHRRITTIPWNGIPKLRGHLLEQIVLVVRVEGISTHDLKQQTSVFGKPLFENTLLLVWFHGSTLS